MGGLENAWQLAMAAGKRVARQGAEKHVAGPGFGLLLVLLFPYLPICHCFVRASVPHKVRGGYERSVSRFQAVAQI